MKKRNPTPARPGGILRRSTLYLLAGGVAGLGSCERHTATEEDARMAATQMQVERLDAAKAQLASGQVANNFHIPEVGYYHTTARTFFEHPYGFQQDGKFFANGEWMESVPPPPPETSYPSAEALKLVDAALAKEQRTASGNDSGGGFGMGSALMMYWLLSGNRGSYAPGAGFRQAEAQAGTWQRGVDRRRDEVSNYSSTHVGYQRLVANSKASGKPVAAGQTVRGGFGARSSGGSSFGG